jgi:hypothetical protein
MIGNFEQSLVASCMHLVVPHETSSSLKAGESVIEHSLSIFLTSSEPENMGFCRLAPLLPLILRRIHSES